MDFRWIKLTTELENGIKLINELDDSKFNKFLSHIKDSSSERPKSEIFTSDEIVALERVFKITSDDVLIVIKTTLYILDRMTKYLMRPSNLSDDLNNILKFNANKTEALIGVWKSLVKDTMEEFNIDDLGKIEEIVEPNWQLNVAIGSHLNKEEKLSTALFHFKTMEDSNSAMERTFLEFTPDELSNFNNQLESAQLEIDTLLSSHMQR